MKKRVRRMSAREKLFIVLRTKAEERAERSLLRLRNAGIDPVDEIGKRPLTKARRRPSEQRTEGPLA